MSGRAVLTLMLAACCAHAPAADAPANHPPAAAVAQPANPAFVPAIPATTPPALGSKPVAETPATTTAPATRREPLVAAMPAGSAASGPSAVNLLQTIFGLVVVLALLAALAWFLKRFGPRNASGSADMRIVGALNLGGRERIVVVEVGDQWIVVGASPGRVNALAQLPRQHQNEQQERSVPGAYAPSASSFSDWLKQTIDKRK